MRVSAISLCLLFSLSLYGHTVLTFQPDSACGKDAVVSSHWPDNNSGAHPDFIACAWTYQGNPSNCRALVEFDLATIPPGATVISATLDLYHYASPINTGHSNLSGPATCWLERITQPWSEFTVTWNNQPTTTITNRVNVAAPTSMTQNYSLNVTALVIDMLNDPSNSFGFELRQQNESYYRSLLFASSDMSNSALHPKLTVTYDLDSIPLPGCWTNFVMSPAPPPPPQTQPDPLVVMPNVFSPNADGINDVFFADTINCVAQEIEIYNRWGNLVYRSSPAQPWDGESENNPCSDGVYYYIFRYSWNSGTQSKTLTGYFSLIRGM